MSDQAHARRTDPDTSHWAARSVTPGLPELQAIVEGYAKFRGEEGFTDLEMSEALDSDTSTYRTRRGELTARNIIIDSGVKRTAGDSPHLRIVWVHRDYVTNPPAIVDAPACAPAPDVLKGEATAHAAKLRLLAAGFRRQGLGAAADQIEHGAELLVKLAR